MKNKIIIIFFFIFMNKAFSEENLLIESKKISINKEREVTIFENEVEVKTQEGYLIKSDFAEYNKKKGMLTFKNNIVATDIKKNIISADFAEYDENKKTLKSIGVTTIKTPKNYILSGEDIFLDTENKFISSEKKSSITDLDNNKIILNNFTYETKNNIFKSIGLIEIKDEKGNSYEFSQIYIDTENNQILGTDTKAFLNDENFKINPKNKPRIFANSIKIDKNKTAFKKSIFTLCDYRKNDKCPPWTIQSSQLLHDKSKKSVYYNNAVIKVYDIPIFYLPKLSHPDPSVDRRSGFLPPSFSDSKNLGTKVSIPYFWAISPDKNFTLKSNLFFSENPLFQGEYHQAFKSSNFIADFGYTQGYKKTSPTKTAGGKSHFFSKFVKNFKSGSGANNELIISTQGVSNDKYLKLYKIKSNLVDYNADTLENSLSFTHSTDDLFFGLNASLYETLNENYNDKYEYLIPEITFDKNLLSGEKLGTLDLVTNLKIHNYDTNKLTSFLINDFDWNFKEFNFKSGLSSKLLGKIKNVNYEAKNVDIYKEDPTSEIYGALGFFTKLELEKKHNSNEQFLTPKMLIRYSPGGMRKETSGSRLDPISAFNLDRLNNLNNFEVGLSGTFGFDYKYKKNEREFDFSLAQIINEKENKKMASITSLDEKLSDLVGYSSLQLNNVTQLDYRFSLDQNYKDLNYNEIGANIDLNPLKVNFNYLEENKHLGNQKYFKTKVDIAKNKDGLFSFETKRNLITDSAEFYNLSYEYINDCLRAGLVYRREFYTDSELEAENSLMFKITLTPFGNISSPSFN